MSRPRSNYLYADEVPRVTLPMVRSQFSPRRFDALDAVTIALGGVSAEVKLARALAPGCLSSPRVYFVCTCGRFVSVLGFGHGRVGCRRCIPWRWREERVARRAAIKASSVG
jgi:hypothetical protein